MVVGKRSVGIVGMGRIGSRCAYALASQGAADRLILVDIDEKRARSEASDLNDCAVYFPHRVEIRAGSFADLGNCDIVAITAGILSTSQDRLSLLSGNARIVDSIVEGVMRAGFAGIFAVITNPCDVLAHRIARLTGWGRSRIFATGVCLDSARLRKELAFAAGVSPASIHALAMGEHGASLMIPWSAANICGTPLDELGYPIDREEVHSKVVNGAWTAVEGKGVAEYGVAACLAYCVNCIFRDEKAIIPLGVKLEGEYGLKDVFLGVPAMVGANGVESVLQIGLTEQERAGLFRSYEAIRESIGRL